VRHGLESFSLLAPAMAVAHIAIKPTGDVLWTSGGQGAGRA
jgi:hypothetical protein